MEKLQIAQIPNLQRILKGKTPTEYLSDQGLIYYKDLGWVRQDRVDKCLKEKLIKMVGDDFHITELGCKYNFLSYLWGTSENIRLRTSPKRPQKGERELQELQGM